MEAYKLLSKQDKREHLEGLVGKRVKMYYSGPDYPLSNVGTIELCGKIISLGPAKFCFDPDDLGLKDVTLTIDDIEDIVVLN